MERLINFLRNVIGKVINLAEKMSKSFNLGQAVKIDERTEFLNQVQKAHREWEIAVNNFSYADDPDLIDYYIYNMEATQKRYMYFIKLARRENIFADQPVNEVVTGDVSVGC